MVSNYKFMGSLDVGLPMGGWLMVDRLYLVSFDRRVNHGESHCISDDSALIQCCYGILA